MKLASEKDLINLLIVRLDKLNFKKLRYLFFNLFDNIKLSVNSAGQCSGTGGRTGER